MMQQCLQKAKHFDMFGASFQPKIKYSKKEYTTAFGGLMSILLYGLSFGYLAYSLSQWGSGQILPKITSISTSAESQTLQFDDVVLQLSMRQSSSINPFDPKAMILVPLILPYVDNDVLQQKQYFNFDQITLEDKSVTIKNLSIQYGSDMKEIEQIVALAECKSDFIPIEFECANDTLKNEFFAQRRNILVVNNYIQQFNTHKKSIETVQKEQIIALLGNTTYFQTTNYIIQQSTVDAGLLFQNEKNYEYATDFYTTSQQLDQIYFRKQFQQNALVAFKLRIGTIKYFQNIQYSKISEVLADVGSIASLILLLSYFVSFCYQQLMEEDCLKEVIKIYFPNYKDFQIKSSIFGNIKEIIYDGKPQNIEKFKEYQNKLYKIAEKKLTILNQVYEISRLQFLLFNELKQRKPVDFIQKIGIQVKNFDIEKVDESTNQIIPQIYLNKSSSKLFVLASQSEPTSKKQESIDEYLIPEEDFDILIKPDD